MRNYTTKWVPSFLSFFVLTSLPLTAFCNTTQNKMRAKGEEVKEKFQEAVDGVDVEKLDEKIDQVADYLDSEKLRAEVDQLIDAMDPEKIKEYVDLAAEYLDRDKIKYGIDLIAESFDREKIKEFVHQVAANIDREQMKRKFNRSVDQIADSFESAIQSLENDLRAASDGLQAIPDLLSKYDWNRWIPGHVSSGPATLSELKLGGEKNVIVVSPGQKIEGEVVCSLNREKCSALRMYRVVLGIKNQGGQTTIFNHFGLKAGKETDHFTLTAPAERGIYQVAFRVVKATRETTALESWDDYSDTDVGYPKSIGLIVVH